MFPKKCRFKNCSVDSNTDPSNISLFRFPVKDRDRCLEWIVRSGNDDFVELSDNQLQERRLCSLHFSKDVFLNLQRNRLANYAVPHFYSIPDGVEEAVDNESANCAVEKAPTDAQEEENEGDSQEYQEDDSSEVELQNKLQIILLQAVTQKVEPTDVEQKKRKAGSHKMVVQVLPQKITIEVPDEIKLKAHQFIELQVDLQNVILKYAKDNATNKST